MDIPNRGETVLSILLHWKGMRFNNRGTAEEMILAMDSKSHQSCFVFNNSITYLFKVIDKSQTSMS